MRFRAVKTWGHDLGLSCCFRQWAASSHCAQLHGYALAVRVEFEADALDDRHWVIDFGALKPIKEYLVARFDHSLLVAADDPQLMHLTRLGQQGLAAVQVVPAVGCEAFAGQILDFIRDWLTDQRHSPRVRVVSVEVREHGANAAVVYA